MSTDLRKQGQRDARSSQPSTGADRLKTVVRRLPPNLPEDVFWQSVQAWVSDETVVWKSYHPGKLRTKRVGKESTPSRAYIAFRSEALVTTFSRAYDGHVFRDKAGNESHAVVEYAPFQKAPSEKKKTDARNNTIDRDEDYLSFLETLKSVKSESVSLETLIAASQPGPQPTTTPLLEALKAEKSAQRDKEAILRNHAHYKDVPLSNKKEEKKKAAGALGPGPGATLQQQQQLGKGESGKKKRAQAKAIDQVVGKAGGPPASAKGSGPMPTAIAASASAPAPASSGRRPPKDRSQVGKGDAPGSGSAPGPVAGSNTPASAAPAPPATTTTGTPSSSSAQGRKNRPTIGLGRQFEAALSGAGVGVSQGVGERKRRDKGGEGAASVAVGPGTAGKGKQRHREERAPAPPPAEVVPSILQRPVEPDVVAMQRPQSTEGGEGGASLGPGPSAGGGPSGRGGQRRGRGARGRGHRGG